MGEEGLGGPGEVGVGDRLAREGDEGLAETCEGEGELDLVGSDEKGPSGEGSPRRNGLSDNLSGRISPRQMTLSV